MVSLQKTELMRLFLTITAALLAFAGTTHAQNELRKAEEEKVIKFDEKIHDFGDVLESDGDLTHTFNFKNVYKEPIVVHNVVSSCGCTTPEWTRQPIMPGKEGTIKVTFSNDQGPYPFDKSLTVYVSDLSRPVILRIRGNVLDKKKPLSASYPLRFGPLGFRQTEFSLGYIDQGVTKADYTQIANLSRASATIAVSSGSGILRISVTPNPVPAGKTARLNFTLDPNAAKEPIWGRIDTKASLIVNGQKVPGEITVSAVIKDNFCNMTEAQMKSAPEPVIEKSYFEFGQIKSGTAVSAQYTVINKGKTPLVIHAVDGKEKGVRVATKMPLTIAAGKSAVIKVNFDSTGYRGEMLEVFTMITNSPSKPIVNLFLTGNVIK